MKITLPKLTASRRPTNNQSLDQCRTALEYKDKGDYDGAMRTLRPLWKRFGTRPEIEGLHPSVAAEVLLVVGVLTGWIGSKDEVKDAQEKAKNLLTESLTLYESLGDATQAATARSELAHCYWRKGALDDARVLFNEALQKLTTEGTTRARAILQLAIVEWSASRFSDALKLLTDNAVLFRNYQSRSEGRISQSSSPRIATSCHDRKTGRLLSGSDPRIRPVRSSSQACSERYVPSARKEQCRISFVQAISIQRGAPPT